MTLFSNATPTKFLYVSANASPGGNGSEARPFATIQAAVNAATPGTAILVQTGTYVENVKLPSNGGGTVDKPIWLISADGPGAAKIVAADNSKSTVYGLGTDNYVVSQFAIDGGKNGIQFSLSGTNFNNTCRNIVVDGNIITNSREDGVKISQAINVHVTNNTISKCGDQGIDFVAVNNSVIANNDVSLINSYAAVYAKGGSTNVQITKNYIHNVAGDGICAGGYTDPAYMWPGIKYEAKNVSITGNYVEDVGRRPVNILGAQSTLVQGNFLDATPNYYTVINLGQGSPAMSPRQFSFDTVIQDNVITRRGGHVYAEPGNEAGLVVSGNVFGLTMDLDVGPRPSQLFEMTLNGTAAADNLTGSVLADYIDGGAGADRMSGRGGNDTYVVDNAGDRVIERANEGTDTVILRGSFHRLDANVENLITESTSNVVAYGNSSGNVIAGGAGNDIIIGGRGNDRLSGGSGRDYFLFEVGDGQDSIVDFTIGQDTILLRGYGIDSFDDIRALAQQRGSDTVITFATGQSLTLNGVQLTQLSASDFGLENANRQSLADVNGTDAPVIGARFQNRLVGTGGSDFMTGTDRNDFFEAAGDVDVMIGGRGDDHYSISSVLDRVIENANEGIDTVYLYETGYRLDANVENAVIGSNRGLSVTGNELTNYIIGRDGADVIAGGGGADWLRGGAGADTFVISNLADAGDHILDFEIGRDRLDLGSLRRDASVGLQVEAGLTGAEIVAYTGDQRTVIATLDGIDRRAFQLSEILM